MDNENKIKLEELPDAGSEPDRLANVLVRKDLPEPRLENLKTLNDEEKANALAMRWLFDQQIMKWSWLLFALVVIIVDYNKFVVLKKLDQFHLNELALFIKHPIVFLILIPFLFKFKKASRFYFELTFNGINGVKTIDISLYEAPTRVKIKWGSVNAVKKITVKGREVLELYTLEGPEAQLIWDISDVNKRVVKQVLKNHVSDKHPMRIFIEKEVA